MFHYKEFTKSTLRYFTLDGLQDSYYLLDWIGSLTIALLLVVLFPVALALCAIKCLWKTPKRIYYCIGDNYYKATGADIND